ncbi:L-asparaginase, type I [Emticicia oligotrophica DSM 17448]|uniref:asparaginase n=1 Tax=Emticicia oligotrophica (strain DSM 17448 / CIP 109782 / MTCC 6937 / GPTSA100-15) TaxID=929562 RepID=A0ABN4ARI2_EMTOG|nr:asparaginase [Emticicia oligotrophica]AFK05098.1 L-asparaginase, type I [Emticicia oligotrophica DSM 17448]
MSYKTSKIITSSDKKKRSASVLMIYTGGTLGMVYDTKSKSLVPFDFDQILVNVPELQRLEFELTILTLPKPIDSSNIKPSTWIELAKIIKDKFEEFDAFVILHGTDTMAYTASALSFLLENLSKPVILTGAQLPIGIARTDARENLITALEIASAQINGRPVIPEVAIYFNSYLLRGNRAKKKESSQFNAFRSENYPSLAEAGVTIDFNFPFIMPFRPDLPLVVHEKLEEHVMILKLFPGINRAMVHNLLTTEGLRGVVLETYGAGNAPSDEWFLEELYEATKRGIVIVNVSQCDGGRVLQGHYQTSSKLKSIGIISGSDITTEAAITKLMFLLSQESEPERVKYRMENAICGEMS